MWRMTGRSCSATMSDWSESLIELCCCAVAHFLFKCDSGTLQHASNPELWRTWRSRSCMCRGHSMTNG